MFMSMRKGDRDGDGDDGIRQKADVRVHACVCVQACMDVCLRVTGDDGGVDYVYVNAQG